MTIKQLYYYLLGYRWLTVTSTNKTLGKYRLEIFTKGKCFVYPISLVNIKLYRESIHLYGGYSAEYYPSENIKKILTKTQFVTELFSDFYDYKI